MSVSFIAVAKDCFVQQSLQLARDLLVEPVPEPLGFAGRTEYVLRILGALGANLTEEFVRGLRDAVSDSEHAVLIEFRPEDQTAWGEELELALRDRIDRTCATLSVISANAVTPIAFVAVRRHENGKEDLLARLLPPAEGKIHHVGPGGYVEAAPVIQMAVDQSERVALLCRLFRSAQQSSRSDLRIFHYVQLLEVAATGAGHQGSLWEKIRDLFAALEVSLKGLGQSVIGDKETTAEDTARMLGRFRNRIAHDGELGAANMPAEYAQLSARLDDVAHEIREYVRFIVVAEAHRVRSTG